jgi:hypothetical protein
LLPTASGKRRWFAGKEIMNRRGSTLPVGIAIAVVLAVLAAVLSAPTMAKDFEGKLLWMLQTQANADEFAPGSIEALNKLGMP